MQSSYDQLKDTFYNQLIIFISPLCDYSDKIEVLSMYLETDDEEMKMQCRNQYMGLMNQQVRLLGEELERLKVEDRESNSPNQNIHRDRGLYPSE